MPERIFAIYHYRPNQIERAERMFLDAGLLDIVLGPEPFKGMQKVELSSEETVQRLKLAALAHGIEAPSIRRVLYPTAKELRAAPLLYVRVTERRSPLGHPRKDTTYDYSTACAQCGAGMRQISPLRLRKSEVPKKGLSAGVGQEFLFHDSVADAMTAANLRGIRFRPVLDAGGAPLPWQQLVVEHNMPPMSIGTRGVIRGRAGAEQPCGSCGSDGYFDTVEDPFIPVYTAWPSPAMPDAAWTAERFGAGASAERRLIVRPAFHEVLQPLVIRGLRWMPVRAGHSSQD
jgi:hypothetical protein